MIESWFIYIISILSTSIGVKVFENKHYINNTKKFYTIGYFSMSLIPIVLSAIRYNVGTDYINYYNQFYLMKFNGISEITKYKGNIEIIPAFIRYLTNNIFNNPFIFFYITSAFVIISVFIAFYKRRKYIPVSYAILMFLCLEFGSSLNIIRQYMAIGIILIAYTYLENKSKFKFIIAVIIAGLCHRTAYSLLIIYPLVSIRHKEIQKIYKILLVIICIGLLIGYDEFLSTLTSISVFERYRAYASNPTDIGIGVFIKNLPIFIILLAYGNKLVKYNENNRTYIFLFIIGFILRYIGYISSYVSRLSLYFTVTEIILLPQLICIEKNKDKKFIIKIGLTIYSLIKFILIYGIYGEAEIFPYKTIFSIASHI